MRYVRNYLTFIRDFAILEANMSLDMIASSQDSKVNENIKSLISTIKSTGLIDNNSILGLLCVLGKESGFTIVRETTKYLPDDANYLKRVFPILKRYSDSQILDLKKKEKSFYDLVYGPETSAGKDFGHTKGDGYAYRGGGYTQLTGKKYYQYFGLTDPNQIETPAGAAKALKNSIINYVGTSPGKLKFNTPQEAITYFVNKVRGSSSNYQTEYNKAIKILNLYFLKNGKYVLPI